MQSQELLWKKKREGEKKETLTARNRGKTLLIPQEFRLFVYDQAMYIEKGPFLRSAVYYVQQEGEKGSPYIAYRPLATEQPTDR